MYLFTLFRSGVYEGLSTYVTDLSLGSWLVVAGAWDGRVSLVTGPLAGTVVARAGHGNISFTYFIVQKNTGCLMFSDWDV